MRLHGRATRILVALAIAASVLIAPGCDKLRKLKAPSRPAAGPIKPADPNDESWKEQIRAAQKKTVYTIDGKTYGRVRYGEEIEDGGVATGQACTGCGVVKGQFHVPGCPVERCPACGQGAASCDCPYQQDDQE